MKQPCPVGSADLGTLAISPHGCAMAQNSAGVASCKGKGKPGKKIQETEGGAISDITDQEPDDIIFEDLMRNDKSFREAVFSSELREPMEESERSGDEGSGKSMPHELEEAQGADVSAQPVEAARKKRREDKEVKPKANEKAEPKREKEKKKEKKGGKRL